MTIQIIVLDRGSVLEQGSPAQLLQDQDSHFHKMARAAGIV